VNWFPSCVPRGTSKGLPMFDAFGGEKRDLPAVWSLVCDSAGPEADAELRRTAMKQSSGCEGPKFWLIRLGVCARIVALSCALA